MNFVCHELAYVELCFAFKLCHGFEMCYVEQGINLVQRVFKLFIISYVDLGPNLSRALHFTRLVKCCYPCAKVYIAL
jgi:hypothetical protein